MSGFKFGALSFLRRAGDATNFPLPRTASPALLDEPARVRSVERPAAAIRGGPITAASLASPARLAFGLDATGSRQVTLRRRSRSRIP